MTEDGFAVAAEAYDRFMGRYSVPLAAEFVAFARLEPDADPEPIVDVGCGPGALLAHLVGTGFEVVGVDPSPAFVAALRARQPAAGVARAAAEHLPLSTSSFSGALAQLVVHFMDDPVGGVREMARVTRPGGVVAACVWDFDEGGSPLSTFWSVAGELDRSAPGEAARPGARRGQLAELFRAGGLHAVEDTRLSVEVGHASFEEWWEPYELGVGPAGVYVASLDDDRRRRLREACRERLPDGPFAMGAAAWAARGVVPEG